MFHGGEHRFLWSEEWWCYKYRNQRKVNYVWTFSMVRPCVLDRYYCRLCEVSRKMVCWGMPSGGVEQTMRVSFDSLFQSGGTAICIAPGELAVIVTANARSRGASDWLPVGDILVLNWRLWVYSSNKSSHANTVLGLVLADIISDPWVCWDPLPFIVVFS